jgi:hypothetical protein
MLIDSNGRFLPAKGWETAVFCCQFGLFGWDGAWCLNYAPSISKPAR